MATLSKYIEQEKSVLNSTWRLFQPEIKSFDTLDLANQEVAKSINAGQASDADVADFMLQLWHVVHSYLRISFLIILRGKTQEAFALLRTAIEMTSHLGTVGLSPVENSTVWVNQNKKKYKDKYKKVFKLFPKEIQVMTDLKKAYYRCCDIGAHAGYQQLAGRTGVDEKSQEYVFYSLNISGYDACGALVYVSEVIMRCLHVFHFCFSKSLTRKGFEPVDKAVRFAIEEIQASVSLRQKQRKTRKMK
jgi:hypothetical protein